MSKRTRYEVKPAKDSGWDVTRDGKPHSHHRTKEPATQKATGDARREGHSQVIIKKADHRIQEERTYGDDPHPPKG